MNKDDVIRLATEAHKKLVSEVYVGHMGQINPWEMELLKIFAKLVAEHEREACAKEVETIETYEKIEKACFKFAAKAIQARGEA